MNTKIIFGLVSISLLLAGGGCLSQSNSIAVGDQPIDQLITVGQFDENKVSVGMPIEELAAPIFSATALQSQAKECGTTKELSYYQSLMSKMEGVKSQTFHFAALPDADYQANGWTVTAIPNVFGYNNILEFKADFDICAVGGDLYPLTLNDNTLLFTSSCGSGYADDTGLENGCEVVSEIVGPTIRIK